VTNPLFPGTAIGATTALPGARPFHRPPNSGFVSAQYSGRNLNAAIHANFAGRSDDSTGLVLNPGLLVANRNLSPGFAAIDASVIYNATYRLALYTQLDNLADSRHLAPIGYVSTPFLLRAGVRFRLGRE
jgi:iron complex outermembrane receptor protein/vitamin B12 transporter